MDDNHDQATKEPSQSSDDPNFVLAMSLQEQERSSTEPEASTTESEADSNYEYNQEDYEFFFDSSGFEVELGFLDDEEEEDDEDENMEEYEDDDDDLDVDVLTYEELIALGEFIGVEQRGLSPNEISSCLKPITISNSNQMVMKKENGNDIDKCVICQIEYDHEDEDDNNNLVELPWNTS
ncbi:hypothetical protein G4B88_018080 [Cannabis sativa]|uniref:Uncharacterized protein n=1 Tax=Cannabis sativa TaxID=3483 RepID=A0A7J6FQJ4_CANSA|nr:hypothetical protein G4B88_018080 [Cannabis sativa]